MDIRNLTILEKVILFNQQHMFTISSGDRAFNSFGVRPTIDFILHKYPIVMHLDGTPHAYGVPPVMFRMVGRIL